MEWGARLHAQPLARAAPATPEAAPLRVVRVQAKLEVGAANDPAEREADAVARHVVAMTRRSSASAVGAVGEATVTRIRRAAVSAGAADGAVEDGALNAARSGGRPLEPSVRRSMESSFGADFSDVRLHTGPPVDRLAGRIQARAFTHGSDIFVSRKEAADLAGPRGTELLAHELTHVVQQSNGPGRIHRKMGVEIEIPDMYTAEVAPGVTVDKNKSYGKSKIAPRDYIGSDTEDLVPNDNTTKSALETTAHTVRKDRDAFLTNFQPKKKKALKARHDTLQQEISDTQFDQLPLTALKKMQPVLNKRGDAWTLEADQEVGSGRSNAEFVTDAFDDDKAGAQGLVRAIAQLTECFFAILGLGQQGQGIVTSQELAAFGTPNDRRVVLPGTGQAGVMQVTVGLRADMIAALLRQMGGQRTGESDTDYGARTKGQLLLGSAALAQGKPTDTQASIVGMGADFAKRAIAAWRSDATRTNDPNPDNRATVLQSRVLEGLVGLAVMYIVVGSQDVKQYVKSIAPLMARNDFAALFAQLPAKEQAYLRGPDAKGGNFLALVMDAVAFRGKNLAATGPLVPSLYNEAIFQGKVKTDVLASLTREKWLRGIAGGTDYMTEANFEKASDPTSTATNSHLESMGRFGSGKMTPVGKDGKAGAVFEIRTVGNTPAQLWEQKVFDIFKYIRMLNDGIDNPATVRKLSDQHGNQLFAQDDAIRDDALNRLHTIIEGEIDKMT